MRDVDKFNLFVIVMMCVLGVLARIYKRWRK